MPYSAHPLSIKDLRTKAEELARNISAEDIEKMSTWDVKHLIQELQVHQVELEMQNEQIISSAAELEISRNKYADLYDSAPVGYMTLDKKGGSIIDLNLAMTVLFGIKKNSLINRHFAQFVPAESKDEFYRFFKNIFDVQHKQMCELHITPKTGEPLFVRLEGIEIENSVKNARNCQIAVIDIDGRRRMEEELDRKVRQRTADLEQVNALLITEISERKKWQEDSKLLITELQNAVNDAETRGKESEGSTAFQATAPTLTQQDILPMKLKDFCDSQIEPVFGSRFWRYFINSKKSYEPMFPMLGLMEFTVQDFCDDTRCRARIKKHYNNETLEKAVEAFAKYGLYLFGNKN